MLAPQCKAMGAVERKKGWLSYPCWYGEEGGILPADFEGGGSEGRELGGDCEDAVEFSIWVGRCYAR